MKVLITFIFIYFKIFNAEAGKDIKQVLILEFIGNSSKFMSNICAVGNLFSLMLAISVLGKILSNSLNLLDEKYM